MGGFSECPAPAVFESAVISYEAEEALDLETAPVAFVPSEGAEGNVLVGVEFFDGDGDGAVAAVFLVDVDGVGCFASGSFAATVGFGVGFDSAVALWAAESDVAVLVGFADRCPSVLGSFGVPVGQVVAGQVFGWDPEVFWGPLYEEGAAVEQQHLSFASVCGFYRDCLDCLLVGLGVVHDHVDTHLVERPHEIFSVDGVSHVGEDFFKIGEGFHGGEDGVEAVESVVVLGGKALPWATCFGGSPPRVRCLGFPFQVAPRVGMGMCA